MASLLCTCISICTNTFIMTSQSIKISFQPVEKETSLEKTACKTVKHQIILTAVGVCDSILNDCQWTLEQVSEHICAFAYSYLSVHMCASGQCICMEVCMHMCRCMIGGYLWRLDHLGQIPQWPLPNFFSLFLR